MDPDAALARLRHLLGPLTAKVETEIEDDERLVAFVRRDMLHLDADALADRLAAWTTREIQHASPHAAASVSFRHARPVAPNEEATLDVQGGWLGLEPRLSLELWPRPTEDAVAALAGLVPRFLQLLEGRGRPAGYRRPDEGNVE